MASSHDFPRYQLYSQYLHQNARRAEESAVYQPRVQSDYQYPITGSSGSGTYENEALNGSRHIGATDYSQDNRTTADRCPQLPEGWTEHFDSVSKSYYYFHGVTQTTQWNIPEAPIQTYSESPMESTRSWQLLGGDPTGMRAGRNFEKSRAIDTSSDQLDGFSGLSLHDLATSGEPNPQLVAKERALRREAEQHDQPCSCLYCLKRNDPNYLYIPDGPLPGGARYVTIHGKPFRAPHYDSWSPNGKGGFLYISYNYQGPHSNVPQKDRAVEDWKWTIITSKAGCGRPTDSDFTTYDRKPFEGNKISRIPSQESPIYPPPKDISYATEHVYELQQITDFFENSEHFSKDTLSQTDFQSFMVPDKLLSPTEPPDPPHYQERLKDHLGEWMAKGPKAPIELLSSCLPHKKEEFVFLESKLNGIKGVYFGRKSKDMKTFKFKSLPSSKHDSFQKMFIENLDSAVCTLSLVAKIALVGEYLNMNEIVGIYRLVSCRIRDMLYQIGKAFFKSTESEHPHLKGTAAWERDYDHWEGCYLRIVQENMRADVKLGLENVKDFSADFWGKVALRGQESKSWRQSMDRMDKIIREQEGRAKQITLDRLTSAESREVFLLEKGEQPRRTTNGTVERGKGKRREVIVKNTMLSQKRGSKSEVDLKEKGPTNMRERRRRNQN